MNDDEVSLGKISSCSKSGNINLWIIGFSQFNESYPYLDGYVSKVYYAKAFCCGKCERFYRKKERVVLIYGKISDERSEKQLYYHSSI